MNPLESQLAALPQDFRASLATVSMPRAWCGLPSPCAVEWPLTTSYKGRSPCRRRVTSSSFLRREPPRHARLEQLGREALAKGECALVVLAGGMATRMGGVVKALVEVASGQSFLDLRLREVEVIEQRYGARPPLWLMTSQSTDEKIRQVLGARRTGDQVATFVQELSLRLTPTGELFLDSQGRPSEHAPGHGDLPDALVRSGLLQRFVERGGKTIMMSNIDNLGGTLDPGDSWGFIWPMVGR